MNTNRKIAVVAGVLILLAYSILGTGNDNAKATGMMLEVISGLSVIAIAALMYPLLKPYGPRLSVLYIALKVVEGTLAIAAGIFFLLHSPFLLAIRDKIYVLHGYIFAAPALIFYYLLYRSSLVPRWISVWGVVAALLLVLVNLAELARLIPTIEVLYLPIVANEVMLALWLIFKGFNPSAIEEKAF